MACVFASEKAAFQGGDWVVFVSQIMRNKLWRPLTNQMQRLHYFSEAVISPSRCHSIAFSSASLVLHGLVRNVSVRVLVCNVEMLL